MRIQDPKDCKGKCSKFSLDPCRPRVVRCQDCYKVHEGATKMAEMAYVWGTRDAKASLQATLRGFLGI